MDYKNMTDEQLVMLAQEKNQVATNELFARYKNFVRAIIRNKDLFLPDGDVEDLTQEGMMGLFNAVNTYNGTVLFKSYAYVCVERMLLSAIGKSNRQKNKALNNSVALESENGDGVVEGLVLGEYNPETNYIEDERFKELTLAIKGVLSKLEYSIMTFYCEGYSYEEIAEKTNKNVKAIDNAIQRIRAKIRDLQKSGKITL